VFNPFKLFTRLEGMFIFFGVLVGVRFLYFYMTGGGTGKIQSLILTAILIIIGFLLLVVGLLADLISANRRLIEDSLLRIKCLETGSSEQSKRP